MANLRLNRRSAFLAFTQSRAGFALDTLAGDVNLPIASIIMAAIALVNERLFDISACNTFNLFNRIGKGMAVIRIAVQALDADNPVALIGRSNTDLAAELISFMGFALTDALNFRSINTVEFVFAFLDLTQQFLCALQILLQLGIDLDCLSTNVTNYSAQQSMKCFSATPGTLKLSCMGVSTLLL